MTNTPFDSFSKELLQELLSPYGEIALNQEVLGASQYVDVYFVPHSQNQLAVNHLGLLGEMVKTSCLIEPYRNPVTAEGIRSCLLKLLALQATEQRRQKRDSQPQPWISSAHLWILTPTASKSVLNRFAAQPEQPGIYSLPVGLQTHLVILHQLPKESETLWLRLLGRGKTQKQAIAELLAMPEQDLSRGQVLRLLSSWKVSIELSEQLQQEERELAMALSQAFLEWEQKTEQRGMQQGIQQGQRVLILKLLHRKFGEISPALQSQIEALSVMQLEALGEAVLDLSTSQDLINWLKSNS